MYISINMSFVLQYKTAAQRKSYGSGGSSRSNSSSNSLSSMQMKANHSNASFSLGAVQRVAEEDELQMKANNSNTSSSLGAVQRIEEEEMLQGKSIAQRNAGGSPGASAAGAPKKKQFGAGGLG